MTLPLPFGPSPSASDFVVHEAGALVVLSCGCRFRQTRKSVNIIGWILGTCSKPHQLCVLRTNSVRRMRPTLAADSTKPPPSPAPPRQRPPMPAPVLCRGGGSNA